MSGNNVRAMIKRFFLKETFLLIWVWLALMIAFFSLGNPLLPIPSLAAYGFAWHHVPEALAFLFLGMWFADIASVMSKKPGRIDVIYIMLLAIMSIAEIFRFTLLVVIPIVTVPSFAGYLIKRRYAFKK